MNNILINGMPIQQVKAISGNKTIEIKPIRKNVTLCDINEKQFLIVKRSFETKAIMNINYEDENVKINSQNINSTDFIFKEKYYGSHGSFIFDMNGIDNFMFAKNLVMSDEETRSIVLNLGILNSDEKYLRFGAAGARPKNGHPGGEVFEYSVLKGNDTSGISLSNSGYFNENYYSYSKKIKMSMDDNILLDERTVYSHTAWLKETNEKKQALEIEIKKDKLSFYELLDKISEELSLNAFSIQVLIDGSLASNSSNQITIKGRVLKHLPNKPFKVLQDATDIAVEKTFELPLNAKFLGCGTKYKRYEPEWKSFTGGREYERHGHIHASIFSDEEMPDIFETFHLREITLNEGNTLSLILTPIPDVFRCYPIEYINNNLVICSSRKLVRNLLEELKL